MILSEQTWNYFCEKQAELDAAFMNNARWVPTLKDRKTAFLVEKGEFVNEFVHELRWWKHKWNDRERILDEFADTIHFIAGISNEYRKRGEVFKQINGMYRHNHAGWGVTFVRNLLNHLIESTDIYHSFALSLYILEINGFKEEDILKAYDAKNAVNFQRIAEGY